MHDRIIYTGGESTGKTNALLEAAETWDDENNGWIVGNIQNCPHVETATNLEDLEVNLLKNEPTLIVVDKAGTHLGEREGRRLLELAAERDSDLLLSAQCLEDVPLTIRRFSIEINVEKADLSKTSWEYDPSEVPIWNAED